MKSVLVRNNRRVLAGLLVCTGFICNYPSSAFAESDNSSVQITTQSTTPQKRTLVGTVVDSSTGETLIGVNVKVQGEDGGTITDIDGKFQISVTSKTELIFSYIGYKTQTLMVGDLGVMTVKLASDNEMLDEVVIVGQGTQKKVSVTGIVPFHLCTFFVRKVQESLSSCKSTAPFSCIIHSVTQWQGSYSIYKPFPRHTAISTGQI